MSDEIHAGGGGSGYIANPNVSNGCMRGYDAQTSSDSGTLTRKATGVSRTAISNQAKMANGFCRITYLGPIPPPPAVNYIFHPEMRSDGHDTVRYNPNDIITLDVSGESVTCGVGCVASSSKYTIENGAFVSEAVNTDVLVIWAYDRTQQQNLIPSTAEVVVSAEVKVTDISHRTYASLNICGDGEYDPDSIESVAHFEFLPDNYFYFRNDDYELWSENFDGLWPSELAADTWYNVKYVIHVVNHSVTGVDLYLNNEQIGTKTVPSGVNIPMFNTIGGSNPTQLIVLRSNDYGLTYIKNPSITYN